MLAPAEAAPEEEQTAAVAPHAHNSSFQQHFVSPKMGLPGSPQKHTISTYNPINHTGLPVPPHTPCLSRCGHETSGCAHPQPLSWSASTQASCTHASPHRHPSGGGCSSSAQEPGGLRQPLCERRSSAEQLVWQLMHAQGRCTRLRLQGVLKNQHPALAPSACSSTDVEQRMHGGGDSVQELVRSQHLAHCMCAALWLN